MIVLSWRSCFAVIFNLKLCKVDHKKSLLNFPILVHDIAYTGLANSSSGSSNGPVRHGRTVTRTACCIVNLIPMSGQEISLPAEVTVSCHGSPRKQIPPFVVWWLN